MHPNCSSVRQAMPRFIREDFTFHGKKLKRNQLVLAIIGAANRDPRTFDDPDRFDITRDAPARGVRLRHSPRLGIALARLEARVAFRLLLDYFPRMTLAEQVEWTGPSLVRGVDHLHISVTRSSPQKVPIRTQCR